MLGKRSEWLLALGLVVVAVGVGVLWAASGSNSSWQDSKARSATGEEVDLGPSLGGRAVLHFWASWCIPCREEIPALLEVREEAERSGTDLVMVAVKDLPAEAATLVGAADATLYDPEWELARQWGVEGVPTTLVVEGGREVERIEGAVEWRDGAVRRRLFGQAPSGSGD